MKENTLTEKAGLTKEAVHQIMIDTEVHTYIGLADEHMAAIGYTEHGFRHAKVTSDMAAHILSGLGRDENEILLASLAGYLHDIGNMVGRAFHGQTGAFLAYEITKRFGMSDRERGIVLSAIGNHEEDYGSPLNDISAAVIIADKADVHRSRVRKFDPSAHDIHDQVNYACVKSNINVSREERNITLVLSVDTTIASVMEYFEIFLSRMTASRASSEHLGCAFHLMINNVVLS